MSDLQATEAFMLFSSALSLVLLGFVLWRMMKYSAEHQGYRIRRARRSEVMMREAEVYMRAVEDDYKNVNGFHERNVRPVARGGEADSGEGVFLDVEKASRDLREVRSRQEEIQRNFFADLEKVDEDQERLDKHIAAYWEKELRKNRILGYAVLACLFWSGLSLCYAVFFVWL
jgi:hypothetical protein